MGMNLYDISSLEKQLEEMAKHNDGEVTEEMLKAVVEAQTRSVETLEKLVKYVKHLDSFEKAADDELKRIRKQKEKSVKIKDGIKKYMADYVVNKGKMDVGTFSLSTRKSKQLEIKNEDHIPDKYIRIEMRYSVDKEKLKKDLLEGKSVMGVRIKENNNLQIK